MLLVAIVTGAKADPVTIGITNTTSTTSKTATTETLTGSGTDLTVAKLALSSSSQALSEYTTGDKAMNAGSSSSVYSTHTYKWGKNTGTTINDTYMNTSYPNEYVGFSFTVADGKTFSISGISAALASSANHVFRIRIESSTGTVLYTADAKTINRSSDNEQTITDITAAGIQNLSAGTYKVKAFLAFNSTGKYLVFTKLQVTGTIGEAGTSYAVSAVTSDGTDDKGTVEAGTSSLPEGSTTTITASPAAGYKVTNWAVSGTGASINPEGDSNSTTTTLTMGSADATVTVTFGAADSYAVTDNLSHITKTSGEATAYELTKYEAVYEAESASYSMPENITVTIGGEAATVNTDYTWDYTTGKLTIFAAKVTGAIAVTIAGEGEPVYKNDFTQGQVIWTPKSAIDEYRTGDDKWMVVGASSATKDLKDKTLVNPEDESSTIKKYTTTTDFYVQKNSDDRSLSLYVTGVEALSFYVWCNSNPDGRKMTFNVNGTDEGELEFASGDSNAKYTTISLDKDANNLIKLTGSNELELYAIKALTETSVDVTVGETGFATIGFPFATTVPANVTAYAVTDVNEGKVTTSEAIAAGTTIPSGKGYIITAAPETYTFSLASNAEYEGENLLVAAGANGVTATTDAPIYVFAKLSTTKVGFKKATSGSLGAYKAYLPGNVSEQASLSIDFEAEATAINGVAEEASDAAPVKVITAKGVQIGKFNVAGQQVK